MKPAFTPGPWFFHNLSNSPAFPDCHVGLGGFLSSICKVHLAPSPNLNEGKDGESLLGVALRRAAITEANARLIAAAPDLYEVVVRCREVYGKYGALVNEPGAPGELIAMIDAALAKANGETQ